VLVVVVDAPSRHDSHGDDKNYTNSTSGIVKDMSQLEILAEFVRETRGYAFSPILLEETYAWKTLLPLDTNSDVDGLKIFVALLPELQNLVVSFMPLDDQYKFSKHSPVQMKLAYGYKCADTNCFSASSFDTQNEVRTSVFCEEHTCGRPIYGEEVKYSYKYGFDTCHNYKKSGKEMCTFHERGC
jgi:hypothetical protein